MNYVPRYKTRPFWITVNVWMTSNDTWNHFVWNHLLKLRTHKKKPEPDLRFDIACSIGQFHGTGGGRHARRLEIRKSSSLKEMDDEKVDSLWILALSCSCSKSQGRIPGGSKRKELTTHVRQFSPTCSRSQKKHDEIAGVAWSSCSSLNLATKREERSERSNKSEAIPLGHFLSH